MIVYNVVFAGERSARLLLCHPSLRHSLRCHAHTVTRAHSAVDQWSNRVPAVLRLLLLGTVASESTVALNPSKYRNPQCPE